MGWIKRHGILVHEGTFSEPTDDELKPYTLSAKPVEERQYPSCARPGGVTAHKRRGEEPCFDCLRASTLYHTARRADSRARVRAQVSA
ncbi:hypothetical protein ACOCJ5_10350 [Knoellia sp. CPCC 206450]|uniref:hypothetical protein n=1 Tax=Knoellia tibetensis TaxID=3404798 RepID=UPI003B431B19